MSAQSFSLTAFPDAAIPDINIAGSISRSEDNLTIQYLLSGAIENLILPEPSSGPIRKDELWKATCFEFFIALPNRPEYWEFNISPAGDWNVYYMDSYRRVGFRVETLIQHLPFSVRKEAGCISVDAIVDLSPILQMEHAIRVGITSIIHTNDGHETYWALTHPNPQADFHLRESFIIEL